MPPYGARISYRRRRRRALLPLGQPDDAAVAEGDGDVGQRGELGVMRHQHDGRMAGAVHAEQQLDDLMTGLAVQVAGRFVREQQRGIVGERAGDGHALLLAARQLRRIVMAAVAEADLGEQRVRARPRLRRAGNLHRDEHVLERGQRGQQMKKLEDEPDALAAQPRQGILVERRDVDAVEHDTAVRRRIETGQQPEQGRLAAAGRPGDGHDAAGRNRQVERVQDGERAAAARHMFADAAQLDHEAEI